QDPPGEPVAEELGDLDDDDDDDDGRVGDLEVIGPVAVDDGEVADAAAADVAGHGGHVDDRDEDERVAQHQRSERLGHDDGPDDPPRTGAHGAGRLDDAGVDGHEVLLDDAGDGEGRGDAHDEDRRGPADGGAHDPQGQGREHRDHDD